MEMQVSVEDILRRLPFRAKVAYTNLVTHAESRYDADTGWSCAYITQQDLADDMEVCLRTATRAMRDLRECGLVRVLVWPGARTETQVRIADIGVTSVFGPARIMQENLPRHQLVDLAIRLLLSRNRESEERMP
ncbi:hypothetical protein [Streptomyces malaysiensis]|uniref:hypothetical protein n=1 Tax=Streptomyces malaysiensis TaxID=92644 RepID=UPI00142F031B|nr:hypothetical protein [Streptomyces malaysiensis]